MIKVGSGWGLLVLALVIGSVGFWCSDSDKLFVPHGARDCASKNMTYCLLAPVFKAWGLKIVFFVNRF